MKISRKSKKSRIRLAINSIKRRISRTHWSKRTRKYSK